MNALESRKQLLIAESELNRVQLVQEFHTITAEVYTLATQARTLGSLASATASVVAGLLSFRRKKSAPAAEKSSWWRTAFKGAQLAGSLWSEYRARPK